MARLVVCQICKKKSDSLFAYKVTDENGKNKYYCNKAEYDQRELDKQERHDLLKYVAEVVLNYQEKQIVPPSMVKRIQKLAEFYPFIVIKEVFHSNLDTIQYWIRTKKFKNEYGMSSYVMTIVESNINDAYKKWKREQEQLHKMKSKSIDEMLFNEIQDDQSTELIKPKVQKKDISMFLDEEDI